MDEESYWLRYEDMWFGELARMQIRADEAEEKLTEAREAIAEAKKREAASIKNLLNNVSFAFICTINP